MSVCLQVEMLPDGDAGKRGNPILISSTTSGEGGVCQEGGRSDQEVDRPNTQQRQQVQVQVRAWAYQGSSISRLCQNAGAAGL
jgi:hypothetical protein